jgi:hypothetical protein
LLSFLVLSQSLLGKATSAAVRQPTRTHGAGSLRIKRSFLTAILSAAAALTPLVARSQEIQKDPKADARPDAPSMSIKPYHPITGGQRVRWILTSTVAPPSLLAEAVASAYNTGKNEPKEYRGTWSGFGKRFGIRLSQTATGTAIEAGLGSIWGEDPRYFRSYSQPFKGRVKNVVMSSFLTHTRSGQFMPAYARFIAIPGSNFLSNTWRADSEANTRQALERTGWGFLGEIGKNAFLEFWPDFHRRVMHNKF